MTETKKQTAKKNTLSLGGKTLSAKPSLKTADAAEQPAANALSSASDGQSSGAVKSRLSLGRKKQTPIVEVKKSRIIAKDSKAGDGKSLNAAGRQTNRNLDKQNKMVADRPHITITQEEREMRERIIQQAKQAAEEEEKLRQEEAARLRALEQEKAKKAAEEANFYKQKSSKSDDEDGEEKQATIIDDTPTAPNTPITDDIPAPPKAGATKATPTKTATQAKTDGSFGADDEEKGERKKQHKTPSRGKGEPRRREGKLTISMALSEDDDALQRGRSLAALKRAREREKMRHKEQGYKEKVIRDVKIPEAITVSDLANRMAERGADVVKALFELGVMATINQTIDGDTAELVANEFGHRVKRVSESAIEDVLQINEAPEDAPLLPRPPVVTIMGHVDHGKTSILDAYREANVVQGEAGGITQHIGAYKHITKSGFAVTFLDTPGHSAFTQMRERGANVTDIVVIVVAADDGIMPQTKEAISHAKAAGVPMIVAINKIDTKGADADKVRQALLSEEVVTDDMGGDVQAIELSALKRINLEGLIEAIELQAEMLELKAPQDCAARGAIIEAKQVVGRGAVGSVLLQSGTLKVGDIFIAGSEWGRVKAMINEHGKPVKQALPSDPVEVLGFQNPPQAGDDFIVLGDEAKAREIADYRHRKMQEANVATAGLSSLDQMMAQIKGGEIQELPIVVKADVHGSLEAINASLEKLSTDEVKVHILHHAVGAISETDISLAKASNGVIFGFNVRANPQARDQAKRDGVDIRYYSIIYNLLDDVEQLLTGMLAPDRQEKFLGYADIREVFTISKVGKIAGCMVTDGEVQRGAHVRLLRDNTVIYDGALKQLKRHKDDVKEVRQGAECGIALEKFDDIKVGDQLECYIIEETARTL